MKDLKTRKAKVKTLLKEIKSLQKYRDRYYKLVHKAEDLIESIDRDEKYARRRNICQETKYYGPQYPSVGFEAIDGSCVLKSKKQAKELLEVLKSGGGYTYGYELEYTTPGDYIVEPSYRHDHDGDIIYTATIKKEK